MEKEWLPTNIKEIAVELKINVELYLSMLSNLSKIQKLPFDTFELGSCCTFKDLGLQTGTTMDSERKRMRYII